MARELHPHDQKCLVMGFLIPTAHFTSSQLDKLAEGRGYLAQ